MSEEVKKVSSFKSLLSSMDTKRGKYRGIYTDVAKELGKPQSVAYINIVHSEAANPDKEAFLRHKAVRDERAKPFEEQVAKAG